MYDCQQEGQQNLHATIWRYQIHTITEISMEAGRQRQGYIGKQEDRM